MSDENNIDELLTLGNSVLSTIDKNSPVGSNISLYLLSIDVDHKEKHICDAFMFKPSISNLLRIINNSYLKKHKDDIINKILSMNFQENDYYELHNHILFSGKDYYYLLQFFCGNFEEFYNENINHNKTLGWSSSFQKTLVYLWLLLLNNSKEKTKCYDKLLYDIFSDIGYDDTENVALGDSISEIWERWKSNFDIPNIIKPKVLSWLKEIIENRVDAIMKGNYRKAYDRAALLVISYSELLSNIEDKEVYIDYFYNKYSRRSAFKAELEKLI